MWHSIKHTVRAPKMVVVVVVVIFVVIVFKGSIAPSCLDVSWLSKPFLLGPLVPVSEESELPLGRCLPLHWMSCPLQGGDLHLIMSVVDWDTSSFLPEPWSQL